MEKLALYPFQEEDLNKLLVRRHSLLASSLGTGKTCVAIELINRQDLRRVLVLCKASIKSHWERKLLEWLKNYRFIQVINTKTDRIEPLAEIVIVNYDLISHSYMFHQLTSMKWQLIIADEAHYLKNLKAKRTKAVLARNGLVHHTEQTILITGTPILNRPIELYPILKVLSPETIAPYNDYYKYARRYCAGRMDGFGFNDKGASNTEELNKRLRAGYMIRRTWSEIETQLPKRRYEMVLVDQTDGVKAHLTTLENAERTDFKHQKLGIDAGQMATLRRETADIKLSLTIDKIKEWVDSVDKMVIFAYHHSVIERLVNELGPDVRVLTGGTPTNRRQNVIDDFVKYPHIKVFIGQIDAAGEGIDSLQTVCHNILFVEASWTPGAISQAIARVWRLGQTHPVLIRFLVFAHSVEEHLIRVALDKVRVIREITK